MNREEAGRLVNPSSLGVDFHDKYGFGNIDNRVGLHNKF